MRNLKSIKHKHCFFVHFNSMLQLCKLISLLTKSAQASYWYCLISSSVALVVIALLALLSGTEFLQ